MADQVKSPLAHVGTRVGWLHSALLVVVCVAPFGPYVVGSIRTEQVLIYSCALAAALATFSRWRLSLAWVTTMALLVWILLGSVIVAAGKPPLPPGFTGLSLLGGVDNLLVPLSVGVCVASALTALTLHRAMRVAGLTVLCCLALNTVAAILQMLGIASYKPFWTPDSATVSVAELAATNSRYSGIFNQPAEAGGVYGIALLMLLLPVFSRREQAFFAPILLIGGLLPGSKVFLLAVVLGVAGLLVGRFANRAVFLGSFVVIGLLALLQGRVVINALVDRLSFGGNPISALSAGRFGENGSVSQALHVVFDHSPLVGFGATGISGIPYDSQILETLVTFGLIGVALWLLIWCVLLVSAWTARREIRLFAVLLTIFLMLSSLGFSPLTANRTAAIAWVFLFLIILSGTVPWQVSGAASPREGGRRLGTHPSESDISLAGSVAAR